MDTAGAKRPPGTVLCRDCYNFRGMRTGNERRTSRARLCAAGLDVQHIDLFGCESYVPLSLVSRMRLSSGSSSPDSPAS